MKTFGKKAISSLTKAIRGSGKARYFNGKQAVKRGILNARSPGSRGSDYVKKTVNTNPNPQTTGWQKFKSKAKLVGLGLGGATGFSSLSGAAQGGKDSENINIYVKRNTFHGKSK